MTLLHDLLQKLDAPSARYHELGLYYEGKQPLAFLSPEAKIALGNRFGLMSSNIPRLAIGALAERLRITGFDGAQVWADWLRNDLDQLSGMAHREALLFGDSYAVVWARQDGSPLVTVESAKQVAVLTDPGSREVYAAVKRWEDTNRKTTEAVMYLRDKIVRLRADQQGAVANGFKTVEEFDNPLGVVPVVNLRNTDRVVSDWGISEIEDIKPLVDALNKLLADMLVSSETAARPRRWASGIELEEIPVLDENGEDTGETTSANPFPENDRMMISENDQSKFGQLAAADLSGYERAVDVIRQEISAVSALPAHMLGVSHDNPASADALRASEAGLTARAEARQATFGRSWEQVARLMVAVREGRDPSTISPIRVRWADASTRSVAQEMDAVVKGFQSGLLPASYALQKLGYSADEIAVIEAARTPQPVNGKEIA
ncbi:phage portal protein [Mycolicibacterium houstonense]|uniref:phage portal protein n=1 Tax=Mycolicibacterium houstonense TaxID=146021 RepID=UPI003F97F7E3